MSGDVPEKPPGGELLLYRTEDGRTRLECRFDEGTVWLSQALIAELFQISVPNVNIHLKNIFDEGELSEGATIKDYLIVRQEGARIVSRKVHYYNLEAILAVGYRVQSLRGTQFRQWATARLEEYLRKGFVMDDERLKNPPGPGVPDYFDELLDRIGDIRASERRMYPRVKEVFALAVDYDSTEREVLPNAGRLSREDADRKAGKEYERFAERRRALAEADGENAIRELEQRAKKLPKKKKP